MTARVSVLMPVFNTARYLDAALNSISTQTFTEFELLVLDDGSRDGSGELLRRYAAQEPRMHLTARENRGLIASRNELLAAARGELVAWMDSDDAALPTRLAQQCAAFDADPDLVCLGTAAQCVDPDDNLLNVERYPLEHEQIVLAQQRADGMRFPTTMMRRLAALRVGGFREPFRMGEDLDLLLRLGETGKMANLGEILYLYRQHIASVCSRLAPQWPAYRDLVLELARERRRDGQDRLQRGATVAVPRATAADTRQTTWRTYHSWAGYALANGNWTLSRKYALRALTQRPLARQTWGLMWRTIAGVGPDEKHAE
jgi:glycosyltransferase involved in cell wall biosynthesis